MPRPGWPRSLTTPACSSTRSTVSPVCTPPATRVPRRDAAKNLTKLLTELEGVDVRTARFRTVALVRWPDGRELAAHGVVEGTIIESARGDGGFGYDPVFVPVDGDGSTFAEMSDDAKNLISHRGRAFRNLLAQLG